MLALLIGMTLLGAEPSAPAMVLTSDRFRDTLTLKLELGVVRKDADNELDMMVAQIYKGQKDRSIPSGEPLLLLGNLSMKSWRYLGYHPFAIRADQESRVFETWHSGDILKKGVLEQMSIDLPVPLLNQIVTAKSLEFRFARDEFQLNEVQRKALKAFVATLNDPTLRLSDPTAWSMLKNARDFEREFNDQAALVVHRKIVDEFLWSAEAVESARAIHDLNDPATKAQRQKQREAEAKKAEDAHKQAAKHAADEAITALLVRIDQKLATAQKLERTNPRGSIPLYKDIVKLAGPELADDTSVKAAKARLKVLGAAK